MSVERLYTLKQLSAECGMTVYALRMLVLNEELPAVRRTPRGQIRIRQSAWIAWQEAHEQTAKPQAIVVPLVPPPSAPKATPTVNVDSLLPEGFVKPFPRSA